MTKANVGKVLTKYASKEVMNSSSRILYFNPIQVGSIRGCSLMGAKEASLSKICHTYPTLMKLGTVILNLKNIQKIHKSRDTPLSSADISIFSQKISNF